MRPNRRTLGLLGILTAMWYAGASQSNAAAYLLGSLTLSLACVSAVHAWSNLRGLSALTEPITPVFEGESILLPLSLRPPPGRSHFAVHLFAPGSKVVVDVAEIAGASPVRAELLVPPKSRGRYLELEIIVCSTYPLGFVTARRRLRVRQEHYVYPKPAGVAAVPLEPSAHSETQVGMQFEGDDFAGVRDWHRGESMRHVDWKAVARGQRLMVKQWSGAAMQPLTLDWEKLVNLAPEDRLRQLAKWVILCERLQSPYRLRLPGQEIPLSRGDAHFHRCMRALATFPRPGAADASAAPLAV